MSATTKTLTLWPSEIFILQAAGLEDQIQTGNSSFGFSQISVKPNSLKKIELRAQAIDEVVNREYASSCKNRFFYWTGLGDINSKWRLGHDLRVVLKDLNDPLRRADEQAYAENYLTAQFGGVLLRMFSKRGPRFTGEYCDRYNDQTAPFQPKHS